MGLGCNFGNVLKSLVSHFPPACLECKVLDLIPSLTTNKNNPVNLHPHISIFTSISLAEFFLFCTPETCMNLLKLA